MRATRTVVLSRSAAPLSQPGVSRASRRHPWVRVPENMPVEPRNTPKALHSKAQGSPRSAAHPGCGTVHDRAAEPQGSQLPGGRRGRNGPHVASWVVRAAGTPGVSVSVSDRFCFRSFPIGLTGPLLQHGWDGERLGHSEPVVVDKSMPWMGPFAWTVYLLTVQRFHPAIGRRPLST